MSFFNLWKSQILYERAQILYEPTFCVTDSLLQKLQILYDICNRFFMKQIIFFKGNAILKHNEQHSSNVQFLNSSLCHFRQIICSSLLLWLIGITELGSSTTNNYSTWLGECISSLSNLSWSKMYITPNIFRTLPGLNILFRNLKKKVIQYTEKKVKKIYLIHCSKY